MQREITQKMAKDRLPRREADANKGSFGSVLAAYGLPGRGGSLHRGRSPRRGGPCLPGQRGAGGADGADPYAGMLRLRLPHGG